MAEANINDTTGGAAAPPSWHSEFGDWPTLTANGWDKLDAPVAAATIAKSYRELQKLHGDLSAGNVVRLPAADDQAAQAAFWERVGAPKDATGYKLDEIKFADGSAFDLGFQDAVRQAAAEAHMPANMLDAFLRRMVPHMESDDAAELAAKTAAVQESRRLLETEWGAEMMKNKFIASRAMDALHLPAETVSALESLPGVGYAGVMKMFKQLGDMMGEARFVSGSTATGTMNREQAEGRLRSLMTDENWVKRWAAGGVNEMREKADLIKIMAGA